MSQRENIIQANVRLSLSTRRDNLMLRFQVGTFMGSDGSYVKIGEPGVSDLIGCVSHVIRPEDVGKTVAIFTAMETKQVKDSTSKDRKLSQGNFIQRVRDLGGIAGIVRSVDDAQDLLNSRLT